MPPLSLLIKPASSNCNLKCKYCFYNDISEKRLHKSYGTMSFDTLESIVTKALKHAEQVCFFSFQGGEPTLAGLNFYIELVRLQKKYNAKNIKIINSIQTNGIIINKEWAQFLASYNFLVGISLDGPKNINDINRLDTDGNSIFNKTMNTIRLLNEYKVEYNILFVVNSYSAKHASMIYNFFKKNNFKYIQFIPCLDKLNEKPGHSNYSLLPELFTSFLKVFFDIWYHDIIKGNITSIRYFDNILQIIMGNDYENCGMGGVCSCQFVIEADGSTYPCDFYVIDKWYMGNIIEKSIAELENSESCKNFIKTSSFIEIKCISCRWLDICKGGCRRNRQSFIEGNLTLNYYCDSYMEFFEYSFESFVKLARVLKSKI